MVPGIVEGKQRSEHSITHTVSPYLVMLFLDQQVVLIFSFLYGFSCWKLPECKELDSSTEGADSDVVDVALFNFFKTRRHCK